MRRQLTATLAADGTTFVLRGWRGGELAREAGLRPIFSGAAGGSGGWILDTKRLPDLLAAAQSRRVVVLVHAGERVNAVTSSSSVENGSSAGPDAHHRDEQPSLFDPDGGDAS